MVKDTGAVEMYCDEDVSPLTHPVTGHLFQHSAMLGQG